MRQRFRILMAVSAFALAWGWAFVQEAAAQGNWPRETGRHLTRAKLWSSFRNNGSQGAMHMNATFDNPAASAGLQYPGTDIAAGGSVDFNEYWGNTAGWVTAMQRQNDNSRGEGVWIFTKVGGGVKMSRSGTRVNLSTDIREMIYDPSKGPERDLGAQDKAPAVVSGRVVEESVIPSGTVKSNWWRGATLPTANQPIEIHNYDWGRYMKEVAGRDDAAEEVIISKWTTGSGITATRKAYATSHPNFDDFFITEFVFENTGDTNGDGLPDAGFPIQLNDTYFGIAFDFKISEASSVLEHHNRYYGDWYAPARDDWWRYTDAPNYLTSAQKPGLPGFVGKKMVYQYDGDSPLSPWNDEGGPFKMAVVNISCAGNPLYGQLENELLSPQYLGVAPLDLVPPFVNDTEKYVTPRNPDRQPFNVFRMETRDTGWGSREWSDGRYVEEFIKPYDTAEKYDPLKVIQGVGNESITDNSSFDSGMIFGPYDLAPGEKAKLVIAWVAAAPVEGHNIYAWSRSNVGIGGTITSQDLAARQAELPNAEKLLLEHLNNAQWYYDHGYDVPDQPPDVFAQIKSDQNANNLLSWSSKADKAQHPDYAGAEAQDVAGYRVYRANKGWKGMIGPWELLATIPAGSPAGTTPPDQKDLVTYDAAKGVYTYRDAQSNAGFGYWYSVRSFAKGHTSWQGDAPLNGVAGTFANLPAKAQAALRGGLESGHSSPESRWTNSIAPLLAGNTKADNLELPVKVVPNPFRKDRVHQYGGTENIRFVNIPRRARISIFSVSGDLVTEIINDDLTTSPRGINDPSEITWTQGSRSGLQNIASGMYFYVVENLETGKKAKGTFMIVR